VLRKPVAKEVEAAARQHGALINAVAPDVFRLAPALVITEDEIDAGAAAVVEALNEVNA
jgi:acetylornithine aminotransferase